jgi:iron complex transport system permease protein
MPGKIVSKYKKHTRKQYWFIVVGLVLTLAVSIFSLLSGASEIGAGKMLALLSGSSDSISLQVLMQIRLPRVVAALLSGIALAVSGAVIQSLLRNPLASPFTLGISSASAFGAAFAIIVLGAGSSYSSSFDIHTINNPYIVTISAFVWSLVSVVVVLALSKYRGATPEIIILSGIIISSLFGAGLSAMQYFSDNIQLASIVFWTFGDLGRGTWSEVFIIIAVVIPGLLYFMFQGWNYKALRSGDEYAISLGVKVHRVRLMGMLVASLLTAVVVSFYGIIAFIGLVVPHIVRRIIGADENFLIPATALFGALFLLLSDTLARTIIAPLVMPVGILTSFIGAPLFLFLLIRGMKKGYW